MNKVFLLLFLQLLVPEMYRPMPPSCLVTYILDDHSNSQLGSETWQNGRLDTGQRDCNPCTSSTTIVMAMYILYHNGNRE